jgi:site-specific DNA-cytosine methylase
MKVLELFAGSRSVGKAAEALGMEVFSSDINDFPSIHYQVNILKFDASKVPFCPDVIWASPPCTTFSVASIGHHWQGGARAYIPKTDAAVIGKAIAMKTVEIIRHFNPRFFFIENPRGLLRKMDFMQDMKRHTVTYCQYGDSRMKPTDIWTNSDVWVPRPMCKNGSPCHEAAPRGARTGTQGLSGAYDRSKVPAELCEEILKSCLNHETK